MSKLRLSTRRIVATAVGLTLAQRAAATTYTDATGDNWGPAYVDLASVNVTNDGSNITFQMNVNPSADLTDPNQEFADYEIGLQTAPGGSTALVTPYNNQIGISSGMNYWIGSFSSTPGAQLYHWNGASWDLTAGFGTAGPFLTVTRTTGALTVVAPLASLGLSTGNQFNFDVWTTFGQPGGQGAYDALDIPTQPSQPFSPVVAYDAATAAGSTFSTTIYTVVPPPPPVWQTDADGDWNTAANWSGGVVPNAIDAEADLFSAITASRTISTAVPVTLGTLRFNNANAYVLSGTGSLTMQTSTGSALVDVQAGSHQIGLPIFIASNTTFNAAAGTSLLVSGPVTVNAGEAVSQTGTGTVNYQSTISVQTGGSIAFGNSSHAAGLSLASSATATITARGTSPLKTLQLDSLTLTDNTSRINLKDNALVVPATPATVRADIIAGQIYTDAAGGGVGYAPIAGGLTEARFTLLGDTNIDGTVNVSDLGNLATNFGTTAGASWVQGDFDYNGTVNVADLGDLATNFGKSVAGGSAASAVSLASAASVPEPSVLALSGVGALGWLNRRRKKTNHRNKARGCGD